MLHLEKILIKQKTLFFGFNLSRKENITKKQKPYYLIRIMKIKYNNLYTHFIFTTLHREAIIPEKHRERIEKFITDVIGFTFRKILIKQKTLFFGFNLSRKENITKADNLITLLE